MNGFKNKKNVIFTALLHLITAGAYNSVVINSSSDIHGEDIKFAKRLDEINGIVTPGRKVAAVGNLNQAPKMTTKIHLNEENPSTKTGADATVHAAAEVQEELDLGLVAVDHPKKWANGLNANEFSGTLQTANGILENLSVSLPEGASISVSFAEMSGNVFEYVVNGELLSGIIYQVDQSSYMVSLSNGPLEGARLRFSSRNIENEAPSEAVAVTEQEFQTVSFHF